MEDPQKPPSADGKSKFVRSGSKAKAAAFDDELNRDIIDFKMLQTLVFNGCPDDLKIKALCWKLLLHVLPEERSKWKERTATLRDTYKDYINELWAEKPKENKKTDHPLSKEGVWPDFYKDAALKKEIQKDVERTQSQLHFFSGKHLEEIQRILFIFAKLNVGIRYVQGLNELCAPIYFVMKSGIDKEFEDCVESDTFFCFMHLISELSLRDHFDKTLDNHNQTGLGASLKKYFSLLKRHYEGIWESLVKLQVEPEMYAMRWILLMGTQDFSFPDTLRLWDSILADDERPDFLLYVCVAMTHFLLKDVTEEEYGEFANILPLLQTSHVLDVMEVITKAEELYREDKYCNEKGVDMKSVAKKSSVESAFAWMKSWTN